LIERSVAVLAPITSTAAALAAKAATQTIPIVFRIGGDPVASGLVPSLSRPGGNITGITTLAVELGPKRLQMLREMLPADATVALLSNPTNANSARETAEIRAEAGVLGVRLMIFNVSRPGDVEVAFASPAGQKIDGLITAADPFVIQQFERII